MEICVLNPYFYPYKGGAEKFLTEIYGRLAKRHNITVLTSTIPGINKERREAINGINVIRLATRQYNFPGLPMPLQEFKNLGSEIRKAEADLYHINNRYQYFYFDVKSIKSVGKLCLTIHNSLPTNINMATDFFGLAYDILWGRSIMHQSDLITGVSKNAISSTIPARDQDRAFVIKPGVNFKMFRKYPKTNPKVQKILEDLSFSGPTIMCNGRFVPQKGQLYLMQAMGMISDHGDMPNLLLLGRGPMEQKLRHTAERLGINMQIRSDIPENTLPYYYSACDILAAPSLYEPASLAALEAMSCELPVIVSSTGGLPEIVGKCGIYAEPKNAQSIADAVSLLLSDRKKGVSLGKAGRKHIIKEHSLDKIAKRYEDLFLSTTRN